MTNCRKIAVTSLFINLWSALAVSKLTFLKLDYLLPCNLDLIPAISEIGSRRDEMKITRNKRVPRCPVL